MMFGLSQRVALISGGSRGIGHATARRFGQEGARVLLTYYKEITAAESLAGEICAAGGQAITHRLDLSDEVTIRSAVDAAVRQWGRLDILVNNAVDFPHRAPERPIQDSSAFDWQRLMRNNVEGAYLAIQAAVPIMQRNNWGRILSLSSVAVTDGMPGFSWYSAAKSSLHGLTRSLAKELGPAGILVNVLMVGATRTARVENAFSAARLKKIADSLPIRRLPLPDEVADAAVFLCSERNSIITGEIIRASGGRK
jgi:NAD(P)-dependent dehydrogenase (short-subunit alcohol dehydrogenase family)